MRKFFVILLIIISAIIVLPIAYNNATPVNFNYFFGNINLPLSWIIFATFSLGVLFALFFFALSGLGWKLKARSLKKQVNELLKQRRRDEIEKQFKTDHKAETA